MKRFLTTLLSFVLSLCLLLPGCTGGGEDPKPEAPKPASLKLAGMKTEFAFGEEFSSEGLKVTVVYSDKTEKPSTDFTVDSSKYKKDVAGSYSISVSCEDLKKSYTVKVAEAPKKEIVSLKCAGMKTEFVFGEEFSVGGLVVTGVDADGGEITLSSRDYEIDQSAFDPQKSGSYDILILYGDLIGSYTVTVGAAPATGLRLSGMKLQFGLEEEFTSEGLTVEIVHADKATTPVESGYTVDLSAFRKGVEGRYTIVVSYGGFTASYFVAVGNPAGEKWKEDNVLKILLIGHSYCEDSAEYLWEVCNAMGLTAVVELLWVGGSDLSQHYRWALQNSRNWELRHKDTETGNVWRISQSKTFNETVTSENWDFILLTQSSFSSGRPETFTDLDAYLAYVRTLVGEDTELVWLMPWSDMKDSAYAPFLTSGYASSMEMYTSVVNTMQTVVAARGIAVVPVGTAIQNARTSFIGDGPALNRDGHHLSYGLGRYIAALTLFHECTRMDLSSIAYAPEGVGEREKKAAAESAMNAVAHPFTVTASAL